MEGGPGGREGVQRDRQLAARRDRRGLPRPPHRHQGAAHDPDRRRLPQPQRRPAPAARPLRLPAAGALVRGRAVARQAPRARRHGDLPREHRGRLRRHGGRGGHPGGRAAARLPHRDYGWKIREGSGIGIKPISEVGSKRLIRAAINYALEKGARVGDPRAQGQHPEVHRGRLHELGLRAVREEFADRAVGWDDCDGKPDGKLLVKDAIADITFQQVLTRPSEFDVIATTNLNGDYLSDALAAQVGGIGIAPGANINYVTGHGVFEATHGTAPKYAGQDKVNPGSVLLSGRAHVRAPRLDRRSRRHRPRARGDHRRQDRHLRLRAPDGGRDRGQVLGVRRAPSSTGSEPDQRSPPVPTCHPSTSPSPAPPGRSATSCCSASPRGSCWARTRRSSCASSRSSPPCPRSRAS